MGQATSEVGGLGVNVVASIISAAGAQANTGAGSVNSIAAGLISQVESSVAADITQVGPAVAGTASQAAGIVSAIGSEVLNLGGSLSQVGEPILSTSLGVLPRATSSSGIDKFVLQRTTRRVGPSVARNAATPQATSAYSVVSNTTTSIVADTSQTTASAEAPVPMRASMGLRRIKRGVNGLRPPSEYGWRQDLTKCHEGPRGLECVVSTYSSRNP